jgi:hypothetical protein
MRYYPMYLCSMRLLEFACTRAETWHLDCNVD